MNRTSTTLGLLFTSLWGMLPMMAQSPQLDEGQKASHPSDQYGFSYWVNGFRKNASDNSPDQLAFETSSYGCVIDVVNLPAARLGTLKSSNYAQALERPSDSLAKLPPAKLLIQLSKDDSIYTATHCLTGPAKQPRRLEDNLMWESGRFVQHHDLQHLVFQNSEGDQLSCDGKLKIVSWPDSLTLTAEVTAQLPFADGPCLGVLGNGHTVDQTPYLLEGSDVPTDGAFTLACWVNIPQDPSRSNNGWLLSKKAGQVDDGQLGFYIRNGRLEAITNIGAGHHKRHRLTEAGHRRFAFDSWHHLALSYDGKDLRFYIDGYLQNSKAVTGERKPLTKVFQLGNADAKSKQHSYANFDQIRIWNRALSPKEIKTQGTKSSTAQHSEGIIYEKTFDLPSDAQPNVQAWKNASLRVQLQGEEHTWKKQLPTAPEWKIGATKQLSLVCATAPRSNKNIAMTLQANGGQEIVPVFQKQFNCHVAEISKLNRSWKTGYTDIRDYDEFDIVLENQSDTPSQLPFLLYLRSVANITGLSPILCYEDGTPTGIPVQLSKNWHEPKLGSYLCAYALLPAAPGKQQYKLRIPYGFYGTLPSASHAQLSLIGYGGNNRWDQLAIGCWGETICFDVDRSLVDVAVTDVRMLMARKGAKGKKWSWTEAGWGGDWLLANNNQGERLHPKGLKTAYFSHGPCLTYAQYQGHYGAQNQVHVIANVQTLRTDDYARTFQKLRYTFEKETNAKDAWLFKLGRTFNYATPKLAFGHSEGLAKELVVPKSLKKGEYLIESTPLSGTAPWWVSLLGGQPTDGTNKGNGYRSIIIRDYKAQLGGKTYTRPSIAAPVHLVNPDGSHNIDLQLLAPSEIATFQPGDTIEIDLEWVTLHREADDYYGPNDSYRAHLTEHPNSWKTTYREAIGNDLSIEVKGGTLLNSYPIFIQAEADDVTVQIEGGVGYVPIRFSGLESAKGYTLYQQVNGKNVMLDQAVHGNDFWQTDYDSATKSYSRVYNLPLDTSDKSSWLLKRTRK